LRGFAAGFVVVGHLVDIPLHNWVRPTIFSIANGLSIVAVSFFFVLSGFVLTWNNSARDTRRYYRNRLARIVPNYVVTWALALVVGMRHRLGERGEWFVYRAPISRLQGFVLGIT